LPSKADVLITTGFADEVINALKAEAVKYFAAKVLAEVISWGGIFSVGFVQTVALSLIEVVLRIAMEKTELGLYVIYANEKAEKQARDYARAKHDQLKLPSDATEAEKQAARQRVIDAARDLLRWSH